MNSSVGLNKAGGSAPLRKFVEAANEAQLQQAELTDGFVEGGMGPLELMLLTESNRMMNRQFQVMSNIMKAGHDAAMNTINNLK